LKRPAQAEQQSVSACDLVRQKLTALSEEIDRWETVTRSTDD